MRIRINFSISINWNWRFYTRRVDGKHHPFYKIRATQMKADLEYYYQVCYHIGPLVVNFMKYNNDWVKLLYDHNMVVGWYTDLDGKGCRTYSGKQELMFRKETRHRQW